MNFLPVGFDRDRPEVAWTHTITQEKGCFTAARTCFTRRHWECGEKQRSTERIDPLLFSAPPRLRVKQVPRPKRTKTSLREELPAKSTHTASPRQRAAADTNAAHSSSHRRLSFMNAY